MKAAKWMIEAQNSIPVTVIGCGGTGSLVLHQLAKLNVAMQALGRPELAVTAFDGDTVSAANLGRQLFYRSDLGKNKAEVLIERINFAFGTEWTAVAKMFSGGDRLPHYLKDRAVFVGCVDSRDARREIQEQLTILPSAEFYYLDCGNGPDFGQVIMGGVVRNATRSFSTPLPLPWEVHPELFEGEDSAEDGPSCSLAEAIYKQQMFINDTAALYAMRILSELLLRGRIPAAGWYFNMNDGAKPLAPPEDPEI